MGMTTTEFFDALKKGGKAVVDKAGELTELAKVNIDILSAKAKLDDLYKTLGRTAHEITKNDNIDDNTQELIETIDMQLRKIQELEEKLNDLKKVKKCTKCGKINEESAGYCINCGTKI